MEKFFQPLHSHLLIPLLFRGQRSRRFAYYRELLQSEWKQQAQINDLALGRLRSLLIHSKRASPYYANAFKAAKFNPNIRTLLDIESAPILTKSIIRDNSSSLPTIFPEGLYIKPKSTGGSTGEPLRFHNTRYSRDFGAADLMRHYHWTGWNPGDKHVFLWGADRDDPGKSLRGRLHALVMRYKWLNTFHLSPELMTTFAAVIRKYKPRIVIGYASSLYLFAKFLETEGIEIPCPQGVQSSAEMLHDWQRSTISAQFGCPVFDRYGCREVGNIAHECSAHDGLHVSQELMHVEVLKDGEPVAYGEEGDIVITSFTNYAFPFIRYHIGDRGVLLAPDDSCTCGRSFIKLSPKVGRSTDNFYFENGLIIHGEFFTHLFYDILSVRQFQVVQKSYSRIVIWIVPADSPSDVPIGPITEAIRQGVGLPIEVHFEFTNKIKPSPTGKHRFTVSEVKPLL